MLQLDDFYHPADHPGLPVEPALGIVDWDDPRSWDGAAAVAALTGLCRTGSTDCPVYDIATSSVTGTHTVTAAASDLVLAEGIFAREVIASLRAGGLLHSAWCVRRHRLATFALRLSRDLGEHRKPPLTLVRRGLVLLRAEPGIIARDLAAGARPAHPREVLAALHDTDRR